MAKTSSSIPMAAIGGDLEASTRINAPSWRSNKRRAAALGAAAVVVVALLAGLIYLAVEDSCDVAAMSDVVEVVCGSADPYTGAHLVDSWDDLDVIFPVRGRPANSLTTMLSARFENDTIAFLVQTTGYAEDVNLPVTLWIDVDLDETTSLPSANWSSGVDVPTGADLAIVLDEDFAKVYTQASAENPVLQVTRAETLAAANKPPSGLDLVVGANDSTDAAVGISIRALANLTGCAEDDIGDLMVKFQDSTPNSQEGLDAWLHFATDDLQRNPPSCAERRSGLYRGAVVFSETAKERFYNDKSYVLLFMAMQHQFMQAGIPITLIYEEDLVEEAWMCDFSVIIIPYLSYISPARVLPMRKALLRLVHRHGVSLILANDFMAANADNATDPLPFGGSPETLRQLTGLELSGFQLATQTVVRANTTTSEVFADLAEGEVLVDSAVNTGLSPYMNIYTQAADMPGFEVRELAHASLVNAGGASVSFSPILASRLADNPAAGQVVHFNAIDFLADYDFAWRTIRWLARGGDKVAGAPHAFLQLTRHDSIFATRWDCDLTSFYTAAPTVYPTMQKRYIEPWRESMDMVSSYYINLGDNAAAQRGTNWTFAKPIYQNWLDDGNEVGSHSFTHPLYVNDLTQTQLDYEFGLSNKLIAANMSLARIGAAQPGNPLNLASDTAMEKYYNATYFSTSASKSGAGYEGAFGFMTPESSMVLLAPNLSFDFTFIEFKNLTPVQAEAAWQKEYHLATRFANRPLLHAGVHPYALISYTYNATKGAMELDSGLYTPEMFVSLFTSAYQGNTEFLTVMALSDRIRTYKSTWFRMVQLNGSVVQAIVSSADAETLGYGAFALSIPETDRRIVSVDNWYAYSDRDVFLPKAGGSFVIRTGATTATPAAYTRITALSMRVEIVALEGDGSELSATLKGPGTVRIDLAGAVAAYTVSGAAVSSSGDKHVVLSLKKGDQTVTVVAL